MVASGPTPPDEQAVLEPLLAELPADIGDILNDPAALPYQGEGRQRDRARQRQALKLLAEAGYSQQGGQLVGPNGQLRFEIMYASPDAEQYLSPFVQELRGIGIDASIRFVDSAQWRERAETFDFDAVLVYVPMSDTPGQELSDAFGSEYADDRRRAQRLGRRQPRHRQAHHRHRHRPDPRGPERAASARSTGCCAPRPSACRSGCAPTPGSPTTTSTATPTSCRPTPPARQTIWWADAERYDALKAAGAIR